MTKQQRRRIYLQAAEYFLTRHNEFFTNYFARVYGIQMYWKKLPELYKCLFGMSTGYAIYMTGIERGMLCLFAAEMAKD